VVTLVSCLQVVALALGTGLAHLLREPAHADVPGDVPEAEVDELARATSETVPE
jgi:hypothetical protein